MTKTGSARILLMVDNTTGKQKLLQAVWGQWIIVWRHLVEHEMAFFNWFLYVWLYVSVGDFETPFVSAIAIAFIWMVVYIPYFITLQIVRAVVADIAASIAEASQQKP